MTKSADIPFLKEYVRRPENGSDSHWASPRFTDFHMMTVRRSCEYPAHRHKEYEVIYIKEGPYLCALNGMDLKLDQGQCLLVKPGDIHQDHLRAGQVHYVLHFQLDRNLFSPSVVPSEQIGMGTLDKAEMIFSEMEVVYDRSPGEGSFSAALMDALLGTLFWRILELFPLPSLSEDLVRHGNRQKFITRLFQFFSVNYDRNVTVTEMAEKMNCSARSLSHHCRAYLSDSPARLFLCYRVGRAADFLINGDMNVSEVSRLTGFDSPFNFSRAFKRVTGYSPVNYIRTGSGAGHSCLTSVTGEFLNKKAPL